ncbi:MAG: flagellar export protein FliJ [Alphaproteobacteria bacterium]|nr:MAG: flagellar export protein FliJ [Alphaproteobacteria bacterium]
MKGLDSMIRLQKWQVDEKRRQLGELEAMRADLVRRQDALRAEMAAEKAVANDHVVQFTFATYIRDTLDRLETLSNSIQEVDRAIEAMQDELAEVYRELKKYEVARARHLARSRQEEARRDQTATDEVALTMFRRQG